MDEFRETGSVVDTPPVEQREWATDLTREEYTRFYLLFSKLSGPLRLRGAQLIITLLFFAGLMAICVYEWFALGMIDWLTMLVGGLLLLVSFGLWWYAPRHVRKAAQKAYDEAVSGGYAFAGTVRLVDSRIEKVNATGVNAIVLDHTALFIEAPDMLVFLTAGRRSIVLPARYLTAEAATAIRQAADTLPYRNRRFIGRVQPQGEHPTPASVHEDAVLWEREICYEPQEMTDLLKYIAKQNFIKQLPFHAIVAVLCAVGMDMSGEMHIGGMLFRFFAVFGIILLFSLGMPLRRAKFMGAHGDESSRTVTVRLTARGVWMKSATSGFSVVPWTAIEHVINRDTFVEITRGRQSIRIPKTYIADISAFDKLITTHWKKTNSK